MNTCRLLAMLIICPLISAAAPAAHLPARERLETGAFVITYSAGDEKYAAALARQLPDFKLPPANAGAITSADLASRREEILRRISASLALSEPLPVMAQIYDGFIANFAALSAAVDNGVPVRYALWRRAEIRARLKAGEQIAGFTLKPPDEIFFALNFAFDLNDLTQGRSVDLVALASKAWADVEVPLAIGTDPARAPDEDIADLLVDAGKTLSAMREGSAGGIASPFIVLHETTEVAIVQHYLASADRRWFCDGVANYVAWKVLADLYGAEAARQYYDLDAQLRLYAGQTPLIDLERWPASEHLAQQNYSENLDTANYAFATQVIADVNAKHGGSILPRLFAEIGRTAREKATMKTVYRAFRKLTGEDLKRYLPKSPTN